jgi:hypothetical protein
MTARSRCESRIVRQDVARGLIPPEQTPDGPKVERPTNDVATGHISQAQAWIRHIYLALRGV